ncbi:MAG: T9SS type A sorting domain-containing protein [Saprospiraceae bacterium]|nr:T9SS type A sorting domain-containing protein [Saprospiraceae bacterium]
MFQKFTKIVFFLLVILGCNFTAISQITFSDNFDSYTAGSFLCVSSTKWKTWDNKPGTATDTKIVSDKSASGANAIKIASTNATGGPTDILLPFGNRYDSGLFKIEWKMNVATGKAGYFNIQGNNNPGVLWTLNGYLRENGTFEISNSANVLLFTTQYPKNEWFTFGLEINLTSNNWKVLINNECQGAFKNTNKFVASLNLYPADATNEFYCDDFVYTYDPVAPLVQSDVALDNIIWNNIRFTETEDNFIFRVTNIGLDDLIDLEVEAKIGNTTLPIDLTGIELASGESKFVTSPNKIKLNQGANKIELSVSKVNGVSGDEEECNDKAGLNIEGVTPAKNAAVIIEEATGTWCVWCPRGAVFLDFLSKRYNKRYIPIAVHNNDPMVVTAYDAYIRSTPGFSGFPSVVVDRNMVTDPSISEDPFLTRIAQNTPAYFSTGAKYDPTTRKLDVSVSTIFQENATGSMWINMVLTEDGVRGTAAGYNQANAYAGGGAGPMGGYETLPNPVPASQMVYDHVARIFTGLTRENDNGLDGPFTIGQKITKLFSFTIPEGMNVEKFNIVPVLMNAGGYVNAALSTYDEAIANGYVNAEDVIVENSISAFPNPSNDMVSIDFSTKKPSDVTISLSDITGKVIESKLISNLSGEYTLPVNVSTWNPGMYIITIRSNDQIITKKIIVN